MKAKQTERRATRAVRVGEVTIGGGAPVSVQTMTKTHTRDVDATVGQIEQVAEAGCEIIRCAVPDRPSAEALAEVVHRSCLPVVADIHFQCDLALRAIVAGAPGVRINPGNMRDEAGVREVFRAAADAGIKVRIGLNSGSVRAREGLEVTGRRDEDVVELMVEEALAGARMAEEEGLEAIVLSMKASGVADTIAAYRRAAGRCDYPFHVGVTAAGPPEESCVRSSIGIGALLAEGIGDTIRVSATGSPVWEVRMGRKILSALGLREEEGLQIISCPTCGRCEVDLRSVVEEANRRLEGYPRRLTVAIMGCVVNGPGEAAEADVGIAGGRRFGYVFRRGKKVRKVPADGLVDALCEEVEALG